MASAVKHLVLLGLTMPAAMLGYHVLADGSGALGSATRASDQITDFVSDVSGQPYHLRDLRLLERDLYYVEQRYVDQDRIDLDDMFQASLERVERSVAGVMFSRKPGGTRLQVSVGTYNTVLGVEPIREFDQLHGELRRVAAILDEHLPDDVDRAKVEYDLINGALSTLDPHSLLLPPVAAREMEVDNQGEFGGLGIEIHIKEGRLTVKQPLEGTPAEKADMRAGDQIVRIEDESTVNMDLNDAVTRLRGEVGSPVRLFIKRKQSPDLIPITVIRDRIKLNPVEGRLLDDNVGYIVIKSFHGNVSDDLDRILADLQRSTKGGINGLVLDLRDNPGGYLNQAVAVSDRFLSDGVIVATEEGLRRVPEGLKSGSYALGATKFETIWHTVLPMASPGIMTGVILAIARAAGEVAPLMLVGAVKFAPNLPFDGEFPYLHLDRQFMHLGVLIYDGAFHSQTDVRSASLMFASCLLLLVVVFVLNVLAVILRRRLRKRYLRGY